MRTKYFSPNYTTARAQFRTAVEKAGGRLAALQLDAKDPNGGDLTIDIAWFGAENPKRALVHSSGLHGVEAFAGSAIQLQWLDEGIPSMPEDSALVLVHVLSRKMMAAALSWSRSYKLPLTVISAATSFSQDLHFGPGAARRTPLPRLTQLWMIDNGSFASLL